MRGQQVTISGSVTVAVDPEVDPVPVGAGIKVTLSGRATGGGIFNLAPVRTDKSGSFAVTVVPRVGALTVSAAVLGSDDVLAVSASVVVRTAQAAMKVTLASPSRVLSEAPVTLVAQVSAPGTPVGDVGGVTVVFQVRRSGKWLTLATSGTNIRGTAKTTTSIWRSETFRGTSAGSAELAAFSGSAPTIFATPVGAVVRPPLGAPEPRFVASAPPASGAGANAIVSALPGPVWASM